jgi:hypothetical protein
MRMMAEGCGVIYCLAQSPWKFWDVVWEVEEKDKEKQRHINHHSPNCTHT